MPVSSAGEICERAAHLSDDEWLDLVLASVHASQAGPVELPAFPSANIQCLTNNLSGIESLRPAGHFYTTVKAILADHGQSLAPSHRVLDYGCGWGRIARFFLKDVQRDNLHGIDVQPVLVDACRQTINADSFHLVVAEDPLPFVDEYFDLVFAHSVFSHLSESQHLKAIAEIARVTKVGGLAVCTVLGEPHLAEFRPIGPVEPPWSAIKDVADAEHRLAKGGFVWANTGRCGILSEYGLALVSDRWLRRRWPPDLKILEIGDRPYGQTLVVARRRSGR